MRLKKIISLSLALLTGISVIPMQLFAASSSSNLPTRWSTPRESSVISQGDIYYLEKKGSSVYPEKYTFKTDGSDGDGIPTNSQWVMQDGKNGPIVPPWKQFYDGLNEKEKKEYILVRDKITITKKDKKGVALSGIPFKLAYKETKKEDGSKDYEFYKDSNKNDIVYTTDGNGQCMITFPDNKWGPMYLVEIVPTESDKPKYKNKTIKLYRDPGTRFLGEVSGDKLGITYQKLQSEVRNKTYNTFSIPSITSSQSSEIYEQNRKELNDGGIWLKFIDRDQFGKMHVFYIAKRPVLKGISWNDIHTSGMVYGLDVINPRTKLPRLNPEKYKNIGEFGTNKNYTATILNSNKNDNKYIVRLIHGKVSEISGVDNTKQYEYKENYQNTEWNRTILLITKGYRASNYTSGTDYVESPVGDGFTDVYPPKDYTNQYAKYNYFGDLTLGSYSEFMYNNKKIDKKFYGQGQHSWAQEYAYSKYTDRGSRNQQGDAFSLGSASNPGYNNSNKRDDTYGFRPVLEVIPKEYDDVVFEGEVTGNELGITYDELRKKVRDKTNKTEETLPKPSITKAQSKLIYDQNEYEEKNGGIWLKFTDYKYKRKNTETGVEEPRTFYIAKKPILKNTSYNDIVNSGMAYGWDIIDPNKNKLRSNLIQSDKTALNNYNPTIINNNQQYIVRLLRGRSNYGNPITKNSNNQDYKWQDAPSSEWNRTMVAITKQYRGESSSMEQELKDGNSGTQWVTNNYTNQTAQYNWFGDLTLGAWDNFNYRNTKDKVSNIGSQGQYNWVQEYSGSTRSGRGDSYVSYGAADSYSRSADYRYGSCGFRPVLEPLDN